MIWCDSGTGGYHQYPQPTPETAEQRADREARYAAAQRQAEEERARRIAAEKRAEELLVQNIALEERKRYREHGHIFVKGRSGCRYRIRKGRTGNVDVIDRDGRITHRLCAHPGENVPDCDTMLAQKLMLEVDDEAFIRLANRHEHHGDRNPVMPALH